jgi:uncharacterized membrane protein YdjX (TVP38/TMEM64 family)
MPALPAHLRVTREEMGGHGATLRRRCLLSVAALVQLGACAAELPTMQEVNEAVLTLRQYQSWAWALGIVTIWADLLLPVPQTSVIAALGIIYGAIGGGVLGSVGLVTGGLLGYVLARRYGRRLVAPLVGGRSLEKMQSLFDRAGMWAIILTRSLPYSVPEAVVCLAGLAGMPIGRVTLALSLGSIPTSFVFAAIGAQWNEQPVLAVGLSYLLPIPLLPLTLYLLRARGGGARTEVSKQDA